MGLRRLESFDEIIGHSRKITYLTSRIQRGTLPDAMLFTGEEGLGKTAIADLVGMANACTSQFKPCYHCANCKETIENAIRKNQSTKHVLKFKMSEDGGEAEAKAVLQQLNLNFVETGGKTLILDEIHGMKKSAQKVLLQGLEYIPKGVTVIGVTTDVGNLEKPFLSRFVQLNFERLSQPEIIALLRREASARKLYITGGDAVLTLIAEWAENKPRAALKVLEAMGENMTVTQDDIGDFINFMDVKTVVPLISSLGGSVLVGINTINEFTIDLNTQRSLLTILTEVIKMSKKQRSFKFSVEDSILLREAISGVDSDVLLKFLYEISNIRDFTRPAFLAAYLRCHPELDRISKPNIEELRGETSTIMMNHQGDHDYVSNPRSTAPTLESLQRRGKIIE